MSMRMLIDARHPEETRVAVATGNRIEEFDFESEEHKQLKGNIYLAKVTRVEPSLQAAFIDYGGNRHGFLAFSEIHPDYYQIPKADRDALLAEEAEHAAEEERLRSADLDDDDDFDGEDDDHSERESRDDGDEIGEGDEPNVVGTGSARSPVDESAAEELRKKRQALRRRYKIQDVIQRRQVLLVQVVKEERGNKGAALTTYLSLAGRYCVLMPNTSHGGGISRKISNGADRKRLKTIISDLKLPKTMGLIVRTAGLSRTKVEIKRDFDYLARLWDEIREKTLGSSAPALIYRDSDLIKRAIRDLYHREIDEVIVEGEDGYKAARGFMKLLMPSHVKKVANYSDPTPIFQRYGVEDQLSAMYQPVVQLKSGGYLVINPTEALVSIDINSGRSTREHNIEQTAFATNLEAAHEIARQLRLRDMAGLVVIDFIDMEQSSHVRKVEKAMKEALKNDRARIQVGRISSFGLMEMSRQRLRTGVLEASTKACPHCDGTGLMRTAASSGLSALRIVEDEAARGRGDRIILRAGREAAIYVLNKKRHELGEIEERYGVTLEIAIDEAFEGARMTVESSGDRPVVRDRPAMSPIIEDDDDLYVDIDEEEEEEEPAERPERAEREPRQDEEEGGSRRRRRRRGGRGRSRRDEERGESVSAAGDQERDGDAEPAGDGELVATSIDGGESDERSRSRRGRRGGRSRRGRGDTPTEGRDAQSPDIEAEVSPMIDTPPSDEPSIVELAEEKPKTRRRPRARKDAPAESAPAPAPVPAAVADVPSIIEEVAAKPKRSRAKKAVSVEVEAEPAPAKPAATRKKAAPKEAAPAPANNDATDADDESGEPPRGGWWQRTFG
ncbi:MAG: Rne/Rng family ribonuclease [Sphingomonas sp.]|uniref:Rne/Rng family ribonuclease n=1 Tax=Sphingomonas sp. TaxID=28214 RepID=UPI001842A6D9|nr:Rne/Rng family ribonuclease [Sphingomonas sp.]MBA3666779.1 Rne/Rng family ribonuclease [Sphingomonas sp.]